MRQSYRLIVNVAATYGRMAVTFFVGLITTRFLLQMLGEVNYGLFAVLGASLGLLMVVNDALTGSAERFLAYEIGRKDPEALAAVFNTTLVLYAGLGAAVVLGGEAIMPLVFGGLTIPPSRADAVFWVYQTLVANLFLSVASTPFRSVYMARQALIQDAMFSILAALLGLAVVLSLFALSGDLLVWYVVLLLASRILQLGLQATVCIWQFPESRPALSRFERRRLRALASFAGWGLLGNLAWRIRMQGSAILLNVFFGPVVNAGFGVATQALTYHANFSGAICRAVQPAMVTLDAAGGRLRVRQLSITSSKLAFLAVSLWLVPVVIDTQSVLGLWLVKVPPYAAVFVPILLVAMTIRLLVIGQTMAMQAAGDIGQMSRAQVYFAALPLPVSFILFYVFGMTPGWLAVVVLLAVVGQVFAIARIVSRHFDLPVRTWLAQVVGVSFLIVTPGLAGGLCLRLILPMGSVRLAMITLLYSAVTVPLLWRWGLGTDDRERLRSFVRSLRSRLRKLKQEKEFV